MNEKMSDSRKHPRAIWQSTMTRVSKSVLPSLNEVLAALPQDKSTKSALYNGAVFLFLLLVILTLIAVYFIMEPFIRPLIWSLLIGSFLFPFKNWLTNQTREFLSYLKSNHIPVTLGCAMVPLKSVDYFLERLISIIRQYFKLLLTLFLSHLVLYYVFIYLTLTRSIINVILLCGSFILDSMISIQHNTSTLSILTIVIAYFVAVIMLWHSNLYARYVLSMLSPIIWISTIIQITSILGNLGIFILFVFSILTILGLLSSLLSADQHQYNESFDVVDNSTTRLTMKVRNMIFIAWSWIVHLLPSQQSILNSNSDDLDLSDSEYTSKDMTLDDGDDTIDSSSPSTPARPEMITTATSPFASPILNRKLTESKTMKHLGNRSSNMTKSNLIIYVLLWACLLAVIWNSPHILRLLPFPIAFFIIKKSWNWLIESEFFKVSKNRFLNMLSDRKDALLPPSVRTLLRYLHLGDYVVIEFLERSLDSLISLAVIFVVLLVVLLAAVFIAFQIYGESIHLLNLISNIINSMVINHPELSKILPEGFYGTDLFNEIIGNAYLYGRKWIKRTVRNLLSPNSNLEENSNLNASMTIERQLLEVWDRSYHMWLNRDNETMNPNSAHSNAMIKPRHVNQGDYNWNMFFAAFRTLDFTIGFHLLKDHIDTVLSILESLWQLFKGNLSLLIGTLTAIFSLILSGSSALFNGVLSFVVFSTSLFYLLCASKDIYKPVEWASRLLPIAESDSSTDKNGHSGDNSYHSNNKFINAFNEGINSVFAASIKMATFYGLYTWLIHILFQARLVYMPSVLAAVFGAVPFISSYWASIPAVIELWLVDDTWKSLGMLIAALAPSYFIDSMIYSEIKGAGHPYLTGLAIAGGVFFLGFEGALFGPILLCCLFVAMNIYTTIMAESAQA